MLLIGMMTIGYRLSEKVKFLIFLKEGILSNLKANNNATGNEKCFSNSRIPLRMLESFPSLNKDIINKRNRSDDQNFLKAAQKIQIRILFFLFFRI